MIMDCPTHLRERSVLAAQIAELQVRTDVASPEFRHGAVDALQWLCVGGPGPLSGVLAGLPVRSQAIVRELAAAEAIIYGEPSACRDYACGLEHALMWAECATPAPPAPERRRPAGAGTGS
jgi:hypothetical protein